MNQCSANFEGCLIRNLFEHANLIRSKVRQEDRTSPGSPIAAPNSPEEKLEKLVRKAVKRNTPASAVVSCKVTLLNIFWSHVLPMEFFAKGKDF